MKVFGQFKIIFSGLICGYLLSSCQHAFVHSPKIEENVVMKFPLNENRGRRPASEIIPCTQNAVNCEAASPLAPR